MKVDAILPVRVTGTRLYGKPLQLIDIENEITILEYLVKYIKESNYINDIILAIAERKRNDGFVELAEKNQWKYVFGDEEDVLGRVIHAAEKFNSNVVLQGSTESPFLFNKNIDEFIKKHIEGEYDFSSISELPEGSGYALYNINALRISHKKGSSQHRGEIIDAYIFDNKDKFKILFEVPENKLKRPEVRITVDYPEDLVFCRQVYQSLKGYKKLIAISDVIDFWDNNPEIRKPMEEIGIDWGRGRLWK